MVVRFALLRFLIVATVMGLGAQVLLAGEMGRLHHLRRVRRVCNERWVGRPGASIYALRREGFKVEPEPGRRSASGAFVDYGVPYVDSMFILVIERRQIYELGPNAPYACDVLIDSADVIDSVELSWRRDQD